MPARVDDGRIVYDTCSKCGSPNGRSHRWCRECKRDYDRANGKTYRNLTPEQRRKAIARAYAKVYKRRGHLIPQPCELCGDPDVQMHHEDYSKPLEVHWLCVSCHRWVHQYPVRF